MCTTAVTGRLVGRKSTVATSRGETCLRTPLARALMISRVLPLLTLTVLFFFFNAEIWQVAVKLEPSRT